MRANITEQGRGLVEEPQRPNRVRSYNVKSAAYFSFNKDCYLRKAFEFSKYLKPENGDLTGIHCNICKRPKLFVSFFFLLFLYATLKKYLDFQITKYNSKSEIRIKFSIRKFSLLIIIPAHKINPFMSDWFNSCNYRLQEMRKRKNTLGFYFVKKKKKKPLNSGNCNNS